MQFKHKDDLYQLEFDDRPKTLTLSERIIKLPKMPDECEMINYGLPVKDQKFRRRNIPAGIKYWDKKDIEKFVEAEWHRRRNGYWILIKGKPFYFPGAFDVFLNYWTCEYGGLPEFRVSGWEWFIFWWSVENDPNCFGMLDIKPRRVGDTEAAVFTVWERSTRYRDYHGGIIHITEDGALKNFRRVVKGNEGMPFFFKPYNVGSEAPKGGVLEFNIPSDTITKKKIREGRFHDKRDKGLGSIIYVEPAITGAFDGVRLGTYYSDEIFKVKSHKFHVVDQWKNIKKVLSLNNSKNIVGKAIKTSTVEEMEDGGTVEIARKLVKESSTMGPNGRTVSGLAFMFRSFEAAAEVDEWGFHKVREATERRSKLIEYYRKEKDYDNLLDIYRKEPATIEEALSAPIGECIFYPERCEERLRQITAGVNRHGEPQKGRGQYGDLVWKNGIFGGTVEWIPGGEKKWFISQHPMRPNNKINVGQLPYPANMGEFRMGCDPFESGEVEGHGSDGAFTVKRLLNLSLETGPKPIITDENGNVINIEDMMTGQIVCDYKCRPEDPYDFFDDVYKTCVYYGVAVHPETTKPGLRNWMMTNGLTHYVQLQPNEIKAASSRLKNVRGTPASTGAINQYITLLKMHIYQYIWCCWHPRVINDWKIFTKKTRTLRDLSVASGFMELACMDTRYKDAKEEKKQKSWSEVPFQRVY